MWKEIRVFVATLLLAFTAPAVCAQSPTVGDTAKREAHLDQLLRVTDEPVAPWRDPGEGNPAWRDWLERTGELPPNFAEMPSIPFLPDPLVLDEGGENIPITTRAQWQEKRAWIKGQVKHWITGTFPPPPENLQAKVLSEEQEGGITTRLVELRFGPQHQAKLRVELLIPPGEGPFPVFLSQWYHRGWAEVAVRRGYIGCVYAGADGNDDTEAYAEIWPSYDFTRLMRRAWGGSRAIDYLYTLPRVDTSKIALTGHSRNGKQTLMAAAFDARIDATISSSGGTGAENPFRYTSAKYDNESIDEITHKFTSWLHPRLRFFIGREDKLPVDQNLLMALIAPRGLMFSSAITEYQGNPWGITQNYRSVRQVYRFLDAEENLAIRLRRGQHGTNAEDIEAYLDFFDYVFGRTEREPPHKLYHPYTFERWKELSGEQVDPLDYPQQDLAELLTHEGEKIRSVDTWQQKEENIRQRTRWALGDEPAGAKQPPDETALSRGGDYYLSRIVNRPHPTDEMGRQVISPYSAFGEYLYGNLYYPKTAVDQDGNFKEDAHLPVVIFLHEYAYQGGFGRRIQSFFEEIVDQGYAVFAFDMIGFGTRIEEGTHFYERYPHWSKMGKMVADVESAVDLLEHVDFIDSTQVYAVGYALGSTVGLHTAALDERIDGLAAVAGFAALRQAEPEQGAEGVRAYSHLHGLLPRLGFFADHKERLPYDLPELAATIAPRPLRIIAPQLDQRADAPGAEAAAQQIRKVYDLYGTEASFRFTSPEAINRFAEERRAEVIDWLRQLQADPASR